MKKAARKSIYAEIDPTIFRPFSFEESASWEPPVIAEEHAQACERAAADFETRAANTTARTRQTLREKAKRQRQEAQEWRALLQADGKPARDGAWQCAYDIGENLAALLARLNTGNKSAAAALMFTANEFLSGLEALTAKGDKLAAKLLLEFAVDATTRFYRSAHREPALFLPHTRKRVQMPAPVGRNKESKDATEDFIKKMQLGEDGFFKGTRWAMGETSGKGKFSHRAYRLAARLIGYIDAFCRMLPVYRLALNEGYGGPQLPAWTADAAKLKEFDSGTWREWANMAWQILAVESPSGRASEHPALVASPICNVRRERTDPYFGNKVNSPSISDNDVKEALLGAFRSLTTGKSK